MSKNKFLFILFILVLSLSACNDTAYYEKAYTFKNEVWEQNVKPKFVVDIKDETKSYDFIITLRTTTSYHYNNLWIFLNTFTPSKLKAREPYEIRISNEDGSWAGNKTGSVVEFELIFRNKKLPEKGKYTFLLEQGITANEIDEVLDVNFRVVETKEAN